MKKEFLIALIESLIDDKVSKIDFNIPIPKRGLRGYRGVKGTDGKDGIDGKNFSFSEHKERIFNEIHEYVNTLDLKGSDGVDGKDGTDGKDGQSFSWEESEDQIYELINKSFEENRHMLKGARGQRGKAGKDFNFEDHREEIFSTLQKFFSTSKDELKLKFSDLSEEEKDLLKLKFKDLTEEDLLKIKGDKGPRGQRGKAIRGDRGSKWITGNGKPSNKMEASTDDMYLDHGTGDIFKWDGSWVREGNIKGPAGVGVRGKIGLTGPRGETGRDGVDAPYIVNVEADSVGKDIYFSFYFSDGSVIETDPIKIPAIKNFYSSLMAASSSGGGSATNSIVVQEGGVDAGETEILNFDDSGFNVTYDSETKKSTVELVSVDGNITVYDEGNLVSNQVNSIDFIGDGIQVLQITYMEDWDPIEDLPEMSYTNPSHIDVFVDASQAQYLVVERVCDEDIAQSRFVSAINGTDVALAQYDDSLKSTVLGISLDAGLETETIRVLMFGNIVDTIFSGIGLNQPYFLASDGEISSTAPADGYRVALGTSNGDNSGFVKIEEPIEIL